MRPRNKALIGAALWVGSVAVLILHILNVFSDGVTFVWAETWLVALACAGSAPLIFHALPRDTRPEICLVIAAICGSAACATTLLTVTGEIHPMPTDLGGALLVLLALMANARRAASILKEMHTVYDSAYGEGRLSGIRDAAKHAEDRVAGLEPFDLMTTQELLARHQQAAAALRDRRAKRVYSVRSPEDGRVLDTNDDHVR